MHCAFGLPDFVSLQLQGQQSRGSPRTCPLDNGAVPGTSCEDKGGGPEEDGDGCCTFPCPGPAAMIAQLQQGSSSAIWRKIANSLF